MEGGKRETGGREGGGTVACGGGEKGGGREGNVIKRSRLLSRYFPREWGIAGVGRDGTARELWRRRRTQIRHRRGKETTGLEKFHDVC